jgi:hypothetical protein
MSDHAREETTVMGLILTEVENTVLLFKKIIIKLEK